MHNAQYVQCNRKEQSIAAGAENQHIHTICNATDRSRALQLELSMREGKQQVQQSTAISARRVQLQQHHPTAAPRVAFALKGILSLLLQKCILWAFY